MNSRRFTMPIGMPSATTAMACRRSFRVKISMSSWVGVLAVTEGAPINNAPAQCWRRCILPLSGKTAIWVERSKSPAAASTLRSGWAAGMPR